jgi:hypothetical protein
MPELRKGTDAARDRCGAKTRTGQPCGAPAIEYGLVCRRHGGAAPQVQLAAHQRRLEWELYLAAVELKAAEGTPRRFDAACKWSAAQRTLEKFEDGMMRIAELRRELRVKRAAQRAKETEAEAAEAAEAEAVEPEPGWRDVYAPAAAEGGV